jgi:hypothetical protein
MCKYIYKKNVWSKHKVCVIINTFENSIFLYKNQESMTQEHSSMGNKQKEKYDSSQMTENTAELRSGRIAKIESMKGKYWIPSSRTPLKRIFVGEVKKGNQEHTEKVVFDEFVLDENGNIISSEKKTANLNDFYFTYASLGKEPREDAHFHKALNSELHSALQGKDSDVISKKQEKKQVGTQYSLPGVFTMNVLSDEGDVVIIDWKGDPQSTHKKNLPKDGQHTVSRDQFNRLVRLASNSGGEQKTQQERERLREEVKRQLLGSTTLEELYGVLRENKKVLGDKDLGRTVEDFVDQIQTAYETYASKVSEGLVSGSSKKGDIVVPQALPKFIEISGKQEMFPKGFFEQLFVKTLEKEKNTSDAGYQEYIGKEYDLKGFGKIVVFAIRDVDRENVEVNYIKDNKTQKDTFPKKQLIQLMKNSIEPQTQPHDASASQDKDHFQEYRRKFLESVGVDEKDTNDAVNDQEKKQLLDQRQQLEAKKVELQTSLVKDEERMQKKIEEKKSLEEWKGLKGLRISFGKGGGEGNDTQAEINKEIELLKQDIEAGKAKMQNINEELEAIEQKISQDAKNEQQKTKEGDTEKQASDERQTPEQLREKLESDLGSAQSFEEVIEIIEGYQGDDFSNIDNQVSPDEKIYQRGKKEVVEILNSIKDHFEENPEEFKKDIRNVNELVNRIGNLRDKVWSLILTDRIRKEGNTSQEVQDDASDTNTIEGINARVEQIKEERNNLLQKEERITTNDPRIIALNEELQELKEKRGELGGQEEEDTEENDQEDQKTPEKSVEDLNDELEQARERWVMTGEDIDKRMYEEAFQNFIRSIMEKELDGDADSVEREAILRAGYLHEKLKVDSLQSERKIREFEEKHPKLSKIKEGANKVLQHWQKLNWKKKLALGVTTGSVLWPGFKLLGFMGATSAFKQKFNTSTRERVSQEEEEKVKNVSESMNREQGGKARAILSQLEYRMKSLEDEVRELQHKYKENTFYASLAGAGTVSFTSYASSLAMDILGDYFDSDTFANVKNYFNGGETEGEPIVFDTETETPNETPEEVSGHTVPKEYLDERFPDEEVIQVQDSESPLSPLEPESPMSPISSESPLSPVEAEDLVVAQESPVHNVGETIYLDNGTEKPDGNELRLDPGAGGDGIDNRTSIGERTFSYSVERMNLGESFVKTLPQEVQDALKSTGKSLEEVARLYLVPEDGGGQVIEIPKEGNVISIKPDQLGYELFSEENGKMEFHGARAHFGFMADGKLYSIATDVGKGVSFDELSQDMKTQIEIAREVLGDSFSTSIPSEEGVTGTSSQESVISTSQPTPETIAPESIFSLPESYEVQKGDTLTNIAGDIVEKSGIEMTGDQKEVFYASVNEYLEGLSSQDLKEMGISSGNINEIYYDRDVLRLSELLPQESLLNALENAGVNTSSLEGIEPSVESSLSEVSQEVASPEKAVESSLDNGGMETQTPTPEVDPKIAEYVLGETSLKSLGVDHMQNMTEVLRVNAQEFQYPPSSESPEQYIQERIEGLMEDNAQEAGILDSQAKIGSLLTEFENVRLGEAVIRPSATTGYPELYFADTDRVLSEEIRDFVEGRTENSSGISTETLTESDAETSESPDEVQESEGASEELPKSESRGVTSTEEADLETAQPSTLNRLDGNIVTTEGEEDYEFVNGDSAEVPEEAPDPDSQEADAGNILEQEDVSLEEIQGQTLREIISGGEEHVSLENIQVIEDKLGIPEHARYSGALERLSAQDGIIDIKDMTEKGVFDALQISRGGEFALESPNGKSVEEIIITNLEPKDWRENNFITQQVEQIMTFIASGSGDPQVKLDRFIETQTAKLESKGLSVEGLEFVVNEGNSDDKLRKLIASEFIYNRLQITH